MGQHSRPSLRFSLLNSLLKLLQRGNKLRLYLGQFRHPTAGSSDHDRIESVRQNGPVQTKRFADEPLNSISMVSTTDLATDRNPNAGLTVTRGPRVHDEVLSDEPVGAPLYAQEFIPSTQAEALRKPLVP